MQKHLLFLMAALTFSATARAQASLADLVFMMPFIILKGIYQELARPWLLAGFWGLAVLFWLIHAFAGRDVVGEVLDRFIYQRNPWIKTTSYGAAAVLASAMLLYVLLGYAVWGAPQRNEAPNYQHHARQPSATPVVKHTLPYPYGKSRNNRAGAWPQSSDPLQDQPYLAAGGDSLLGLSNGSDEGLWVRLCAADANPCSPLRQVYLEPRGGYVLDRVEQGHYRLIYIQTSGQNLSGSSPAFFVGGDRMGSFNVALNEFIPKP